ncbi:1-acyl-sn-glycerol-3-phosphate acyltransferase [Mesobacterium pallidum]|uniref:1-acyl-sn-glycerol-3-phosphate acyltransferase n=1 Tax=Mesobacterium pallidum TaxID=2872037 RepID=UPI001EE33860|nr:1-acyl-sn-glycerol-3-phosphate acyltransferase [Mesobacterium pallidum]
MTMPVTLPLWAFVLILLFAAVTFASHFLFPSVRWFFRKRMERAVRRLNRRLQRPIQPFKLLGRHDMIQRLVYDPEVNRAIVAHARAEGIPEAVAFETAKRYAREIVPSFSTMLYFGVATRAARLLSRAFYTVRVNDDPEPLDGVDPEATVIFVMNHRSNMDYVLVTYLAAQRSALAYAVGEWARVWPLSWLIRALGGYFIRRRSRNDLYRKVLARFVRMVTDNGVTQAIYPEGGLSLDGAMAPPKLGLLKYITDGFDPTLRDVVFVPVGLNYDRVLEDRILITAGKAGERRFRARISVVFLNLLRLILRWMTGRYRRFGTAAVSFGAPLSLADFVAGRTEGDPTRDLARELARRIGAVIPVVSVPLVARILLDHAPMDRAALVARAETRLAALRPHAIDAASDRVESALEILQRRRIVSIDAGGIIRVTETEHAILEYYARSISHLGAPD